MKHNCIFIKYFLTLFGLLKCMFVIEFTLVVWYTLLCLEQKCCHKIRLFWYYILILWAAWAQFGHYDIASDNHRVCCDNCLLNGWYQTATVSAVLLALSMYATSMYDMLLCFISYLSVTLIIFAWKCSDFIHIDAHSILQVGSCSSKFSKKCCFLYIFLFVLFDISH